MQSRRSSGRSRSRTTLWCQRAVAGAALWLQSARADEAWPGIETVPLPPLILAGQAAHAHTQGLEIVAGTTYVTARREDVQPKRALLLRTAPGQRDWSWWDLTPETLGPRAGDAGWLDHPGGLQASGGKLWIPIAESRRGGRTLIRAYSLEELTPNQPAKPVSEFAVDDHIGAVAVSQGDGRVVGASWDTASVYTWDQHGKLDRTLSGAGLARHGLGVATAPDGRPGVAVQDWKIVGERLLGCGLRRPGSGGAAFPAQSWLVSVPVSWDGGVAARMVPLPTPAGIDLAREGMAVADGVAHFLPEDLGATNRLFRLDLKALGF